MKSTVVDESLSSFKPMYCSREYQASTRLSQQYEKSTSKDGEDWNLSGMTSTMASLLLRVSGTGRCTSYWLPTTLMTLRCRIKVRLLWHRCTNRPWHRPLLNIKLKPNPRLSPGTHLRCWRLGQSKGGLVVGLCQGPVDASINASLTGKHGILSAVKENWEALNSQCCLETELKR